VTLTDDLEIQSHIILFLTLPISASTHSIATNLFLFLMLYDFASDLKYFSYCRCLSSLDSEKSRDLGFRGHLSR